MDAFLPLLTPVLAVLATLAMAALFAGAESRDGFDTFHD